MQRCAGLSRGRLARIAGIVLAAGLAAALLRRPLARVASLVLTAAVVAFLAEPLARLFERRLSRPAAALASLLAIALALVAALGWLLPTALREASGLAQTLPQTLARLSALLDDVAARLEAHLPGLSIPGIDWSAANGALAGLASGTVRAAVNLAAVAGRLSMAVVLAYFMLRDREALALRLELLLPQSARHTAVRMGNAVSRELRHYLRGQLTIALTVSALAAAGLAVVGVRGALALGLIVGILNMIPYFGPYIGGVPAVLVALGDGWRSAAMAIAVLVIVQQLDGSVISPRVLGSATGLSPALVLVAVYAGAALGGVAGMLLAVPAMMTARTIGRVFIQKS